jgi:transcriptional regulator with XRE-family HTH domain
LFDIDDRRQELAHFLRTKRVENEPTEMEKVGRRRSSGLRREDVANRAKVSLTWYTWLEQGRDIQVSDFVLNGLSDALKLSIVEKEHLFSLAGRSFKPEELAGEFVEPSGLRLLEAVDSLPAYITGRRWDILAWNQCAKLILNEIDSRTGLERNVVWRLFASSPHQRPDDKAIKEDTVARLRLSMDRYLGDPSFQELLAYLNSFEEFQQIWNQHKVKRREGQRKVIDNSEFGRLDFEMTILKLDTVDQHLVVYNPFDNATKNAVKRWKATAF